MFTCNHSISWAHSAESSKPCPGDNGKVVFWDKHSVSTLTLSAFHWRPPWRPLVISGMRLTDVKIHYAFFQSLFLKLSVCLSHSFTLLQTQWLVESEHFSVFHYSRLGSKLITENSLWTYSQCSQVLSSLRPQKWNKMARIVRMYFSCEPQ